nr:MAG TPA_asm: hypothetical protein [Bacteriophage sp.]
MHYENQLFWNTMDLCPCVRNTYRGDVCEHVFYEHYGL